MINPLNITNFNRSVIELQEYFLFSVCVADRIPTIQGVRLTSFLKPSSYNNMTPFEYIEYLIDNDILLAKLHEFKMGQNRRLEHILRTCTKLDLVNITTEELEKIPGIGPKTARFFILHTRPNQRMAVLDAHILTWLRENVEGVTVPSSTPESGSRYRKLEGLFLIEADKLDIKPEDLDWQIWNSKSRSISA